VCGRPAQQWPKLRREYAESGEAESYHLVAVQDKGQWHRTLSRRTVELA